MNLARWLARRGFGHCLAVLGTVLIASCSSGEQPAVEGVVVFDDDVMLVRGESADAAQRELLVDSDAVFVAVAREYDGDVRLRLSHEGVAGISPASVEVESFMLDTGIEIAVFDVPRGARLKVSLSGPRDFERPRKISLKVFRYDRKAASAAPAAARIAALRAWTAATDRTLRGADIESTSIPQLDAALGYLESENGDRELAAWARLLRSRFNYRQVDDLKTSLRDARMAIKRFEAEGDARNAARAQFLEATVLIEIATDTTATDPNADEAARGTTRLLTALRDDPLLSAFERARCVGYLAANYFNSFRWDEARATFLEALALYEKVGYRHGRRQILTNLGVLSTELGDNRSAVHYFDLLTPEIDEVADKSQRVLILYSAALGYLHAGDTDRAIDLLTKAQASVRALGLKQYESLVLHGLGRAYWERGDIAQAATLLRESLKQRRTLDAGVPLMISLRANGSLARVTGDIGAALALHRELESMARSPELKLNALYEIALDYTAGSNYDRAVDTGRRALALPVKHAEFYRRSETQLALADALLSRPQRPAGTVREAISLSREALATAVHRSDIPLEVASRRLLAQALVANREYREARGEYERAVALIFKYRSGINNPEMRAVALDHEQKTFRGYVDLLMRDVARRGPGTPIAVGEPEETALRTLERARALKFDAAAASQLDAATQVRLADLLARMAAKRVRISALLDREEIPARELEILQLDIAELRAEVDSLRSTASNNPGAAMPAAVIEKSWPVLPRGVTQLSFALDTTHPYLWVRDATGIRSTMLAAQGGEIAHGLGALAAAARSRAPAKVEVALVALSRTLLPAGTLAEGTTTLEMVADGSISRIPFAALTLPEEQAGRLADHRSIVMITSMFAAREPSLHQPRTLRLAALASDTHSGSGAMAAQAFPNLQGTDAEARSIAAMFRASDPKSAIQLMFGADGNAGNLKKTWHEGVDVIHFATHGLADLRQPLTSLLLLPALDGDGAPTYLTAGQVQEWRGDADLVYLSACETAVGHGMQEAFLRAGARGVIATLWPVEDVYASQFAADFYRRYTAGVPAPQALSETQRAWMHPQAGIREADLPYRRMTAWAHAYYAQ